MTPAQLAVAWVLQNTSVESAIIGTSRPEQLTDNVTAPARLASRHVTSLVAGDRHSGLVVLVVR